MFHAIAQGYEFSIGQTVNNAGWQPFADRVVYKTVPKFSISRIFDQFKDHGAYIQLGDAGNLADLRSAEWSFCGKIGIAGTANPCSIPVIDEQ
jgi:hypothetical protein